MISLFGPLGMGKEIRDSKHEIRNNTKAEMDVETGPVMKKIMSRVKA